MERKRQEYFDMTAEIEVARPMGIPLTTEEFSRLYAMNIQEERSPRTQVEAKRTKRAVGNRLETDASYAINGE